MFVRQLLGIAHPETVKTLNHLAHAAFLMSDISSALKHWNNALMVMGDAFGRDHTETAETLTGLGNTYNALGEKDKALEYHLRALRILEDWLGVDHVLVAGTPPPLHAALPGTSVRLRACQPKSCGSLSFRWVASVVRCDSSCGGASPLPWDPGEGPAVLRAPHTVRHPQQFGRAVRRDGRERRRARALPESAVDPQAAAR